MNTLNRTILAAVAALLIPAAAFAQPGGGNLAGGTGLDGVKKQIRSTEEEWKVVGPLLQSVVSSRQVAEYSLLDQPGTQGSGGMFGGPNGGGRGGFGGGGPGGRGGPGGGDSFAEPGSFGGGGPGGGGRGGRGGFGGPGGGGPGGDSFGEPGAGGFGGPGGPGGFGRGGGAGGPGGFPPGGGPDAGGASTNAPGGFGNGANFNGPMGGGFPGMGGDFLGMGGGANHAVALAVTQLGTALSATNTPVAELQEKMVAVRDARRRAVADLDVAQHKLRQLLTLEQEAVLIGLGYLD